MTQNPVPPSDPAGGVLLTEQTGRRGFLRGLILAPAAAVATHRLILPNEATPAERARRAWADFSAAMREMTAENHGWIVAGAGERKAFRDLPASAWLDARAIEYVADTEPRAPRLIVERFHQIAGLSLASDLKSRA